MGAYLKVCEGDAYSEKQKKSILYSLQQRLKSIREVSVYINIFNHV